ncbi:hypothetical protein Patl1_02477 [Pistacia atlantica]|uniref:Uncharacterized protein n=1 Tax=Pistacia atlantica TaxID=434234 RepID=A0ACC1C8U0_9ROSI|nr:hypothetical protein Patl1_02477 [Pistacia atlantica]
MTCNTRPDLMQYHFFYVQPNTCKQIHSILSTKLTNQTFIQRHGKESKFGKLQIQLKTHQKAKMANYI